MIFKLCSVEPTVLWMLTGVPQPDSDKANTTSLDVSDVGGTEKLTAVVISVNSIH